MDWISLAGTTLSLATLLVVFLMGTPRRVTGYWIGIPTQVGWCLYCTLLIHQPALLTLQAPLLLIYGRHLLAHYRRPAPVAATDDEWVAALSGSDAFSRAETRALFEVDDAAIARLREAVTAPFPPGFPNLD